jgi:drug/metabolite transporter (DMT)-like permease
VSAARATPDRLTLLAFGGAVLIGGLNFVAVRASNAELPPFWGAAARFGVAAILLLAYMAARRMPLPRGAALAGAVVYGFLGFAAGYALAYWALVHVPAGLASVIMSTVPLLTFFLATLHGLEAVRWRALAGGLLAFGGIALVFREQLGSAVPLVSIIAMGGAAISAAETGVVMKRFPRTHPIASNAVGMSVGALLLLAIALASGEALALPSLPGTWFALTYLSIIGSIGLFVLFVFVLTRWTASATSYMFVLTPLVAIPVGAALAGESVSLVFLAGGAIVLAGVYFGAIARPKPRALEPEPESVGCASPETAPALAEAPRVAARS